MPTSNLPAPQLKLARLSCRLDITPKSLLYYGKRETFGAKYYPSQYPDWLIAQNTLTLTDHKRERRVILDPSFIKFEIEDAKDILPLRKHILSIIDDYLGSVVSGSELRRFGWALEFLTEGYSFAQLFPAVRTIMCPESSAWWKAEGYGLPRDFLATAFLGKEDDGLNVSLNVLTGDEAADFFKPTAFKRTRAPLAISEGALALTLDRHIKAIPKRDVFDRIAGEHQNLIKTAEAIVERIFANQPTSE